MSENCERHDEPGCKYDLCVLRAEYRLLSERLAEAEQMKARVSLVEALERGHSERADAYCARAEAAEKRVKELAEARHKEDGEGCDIFDEDCSVCWRHRFEAAESRAAALEAEVVNLKRDIIGHANKLKSPEIAALRAQVEKILAERPTIKRCEGCGIAISECPRINIDTTKTYIACCPDCKCIAAHLPPPVEQAAKPCPPGVLCVEGADPDDEPAKPCRSCNGDGWYRDSESRQNVKCEMCAGSGNSPFPVGPEMSEYCRQCKDAPCSCAPAPTPEEGGPK